MYYGGGGGRGQFGSGPCGPAAPMPAQFGGGGMYSASPSGFGGGGGGGPFATNSSDLGQQAQAQMGPLAAELRRIFRELGPEGPRAQRISEAVQRSSDRDAAECIPLILDRLVDWSSGHALGIHALTELLRMHPVQMVNCLTPQRVYDLFNPKTNDWPPAKFLYDFLSYKNSQGFNCRQDAEKLQKLLCRRAKVSDLRRIAFTGPAAQSLETLRSCLVRIWLDIPSARPETPVLAGCCCYWLASRELGPEEKMPCLGLIHQEVRKKDPVDGEVWLLSLFFEQVCRDPEKHTPDLQQLLYMLPAPPPPAVLKKLLAGLLQEQGRLVTLWVCLSVWPTQPPLPELGAPPSPTPMLHGLMRSLLVVFSQLPSSDDLCRTSVLTLACTASSGEGALSSSASSLLLYLFQEGPILPGAIWLTSVPILENAAAQKSAGPAATQLLQRIRQRSSGGSSDSLRMTQSGNYLNGAFGSSQGQPNQQQYYSNYSQGPNPYGSATPGQQQQQMQQQQQQMQHQQMQQQQMQQQPPGGPPQNQQVAVAQPQQAAPVGPCPPDRVEFPWEAPRVGLQNTNNTCYMNTFIQGLFMTNQFVARLMNFKLKLKKNASKVDKEDYDFGKKVVNLLQRQMTRMTVTKYKHTDIQEILNGFPADYRSGQQQDVTETIRFVFDKLGGFDQPLIREVFAGELAEKLQCQVCKNVKSRPETFSDIVLSCPKAEDVEKTGRVPTTQELLDQRLQYELMDENEPVTCDVCQKKTRAGKWAEIVSPPAQLCICLNRFSFNIEAMDFTKEKTPVNVLGDLRIGPFVYSLYFVIVHTGKDATSGHYYAIGHRSEGQGEWTLMDDSQLKAPDMGLLKGEVSEKLKDDTPYVLFYRCQQAPPSPPMRAPQALTAEIKSEQDARVES